MFEIPEYVTLARQMAESLSGKRIANGTLGNSPHKFVWYNRKPAEFSAIVKGKTIGKAYSKGKWLFIPIQPGYLLVFGECGSKIILHESGSQLPKKYHLSLHFEDGSCLSATTQMWGAMELFRKERNWNGNTSKACGLLQLIQSLVWHTYQRSSRNVQKKEVDL